MRRGCAGAADSHDLATLPSPPLLCPSLQIDYYLALGAHQFMGNSVSIFSALLIMERWHAGRFATYYNGGNIPLEAFMPLYQ